MKKIIIGLVGEAGSGKDTVANHLKDKYGVTLLRFVDPINSALGIFFDKYSRQDQIWLVDMFTQRFGSNILCRAIEKRIQKEEGTIVLNGVRLLEDEKFIRSLENSHIIYIIADQKFRWERTRNRGEKTDDGSSFEKFQEVEREFTEVHIPEIGSRADYVIRNEKDLDFLLTSIDEIIEKLK